MFRLKIEKNQPLESENRQPLWLKHPSSGSPGFRRTMYVLAFAVPTLLMLIMFIIRGIYPFGDRSFLFSDMYHQYMPFFSEFMHKIKAGEGLGYSYNVGIGSNFLALYVYYLASPLHWLAFLFPAKHLMEFMSYLAVVKIGLCGLTSFVYLRKHFHTRDSAALLFSCFYSLSGFLAAYNWNIMWLDCVVLFPLILLGLERLVKEGRCGLYCVVLGLSIFTNYYISIMICIFLVVYFVALLFTSSLTERKALRAVGNFALFSLLAAGMAAVLLIPEVCAILETDFGDMDFPKTVTSYFSVLDVMARHCLGVTTERGLDHWPNIYCGSAVFMLIPLYLMNRKISIRKKFFSLGMAMFLLFGFSTNLLDFIWHGLNYPDSLPARQSFIYILLVITVCYEAYLRIDELEPQKILYGYLVAVLFVLGCEKFVDSEHFSFGTEISTLLFITVYAVLLYLRRTRESRSFRRGLAILAFAAVALEAGANTLATSVGTTSRSQYLGQQADYRALADQATEREAAGAFFRFEKFTRKTKNDGTLTGYPTASLFSSTMNSYVADLYKKWGMRYSKVYYGFDGATAFTSALLNVNYMFGENGEEDNSLYTLLDSSGDIYLYECAYALPFGYVAPPQYDLPENFGGDAPRLQNRMVQELGVDGRLFTEADCAKDGDKVKITADQAGYYYGVVNAYGTGKLNAYGSRSDRKFNDLKDGSVVYLGYLQEGDQVTLENGDEKDESPEFAMKAYRLDEEVLREAIALLSADHLEDVSYDSTHISGTVNLEKPGRLILSVPFEEGWTAVLDGEETEPALFGGTLMAFDLEPGRHTLELHYVPHGAEAGIVVSVAGIAVFAGIMLFSRRRHSPFGGRRKKMEGAVEQADGC